MLKRHAQARIGAAVLAVLIAGPVVAAVAAVAEALVITIAVLGGLAIAGGAAFLLYRARGPAPVQGLGDAPRPASALVSCRAALSAETPGDQRSTGGAPCTFHGVTAEDVAHIIARTESGHPG